MESPSQVQTILWSIIDEFQDYVLVNDKTETDLDLAITVKNIMLRFKLDADEEINSLEYTIEEERRSYLFEPRWED